MKPELHIFGIEIPLFGLMIATGVLCLTIIVIHLFRRHNVSEAKIDQLIVITAASGAMFALGASFFDGLWHSLSDYKLTGVFQYEFYGITFSGGLLTGFAAYMIIFYIFSKYDRYNMFFYLDFIVIGICIAHAFGRIGCFFGGCCYGKVVPEGTFLSMMYPTSKGMQNVYPTQLFESVFLFVFTFVLLFFVKKNRSAWYFIGYNVFRFLLEGLRGDDRGASPFGFLSPSQFLSIVMLAFGIVLLIFRKQIEAWLLKKTIHLDDSDTTNQIATE